MATIIDQYTLYTLTDEAAEFLVGEGKIEVCMAPLNHQPMLDADLPVYHVYCNYAGPSDPANICRWITDAHQILDRS